MELQTMGRAAAKSIRLRIPRDPARDFANRIKNIADAS
jgi:hypothetical protein